jgi:hypothetical protein
LEESARGAVDRIASFNLSFSDCNIATCKINRHAPRMWKGNTAM